MSRTERPLSPFWVYRWRINMVLSSMHRLTGLFLALGAVAFAVWLIALAGGVEAYERVRPFYGSLVFKALAIGWTFCFFLHLFNGIRHLVWDTGYGFEPRQIRAGGWAVVGATAVATVIFSLSVLA